MAVKTECGSIKDGTVMERTVVVSENGTSERSLAILQLLETSDGKVHITIPITGK
jgi:hypothetical protein